MVGQAWDEEDAFHLHQAAVLIRLFRHCQSTGKLSTFSHILPHSVKKRRGGSSGASFNIALSGIRYRRRHRSHIENCLLLFLPLITCEVVQMGTAQTKWTRYFPTSQCMKQSMR